MDGVVLDFKLETQKANKQLKSLNDNVKEVGKQVSVTRLAIANAFGAAIVGSVKAVASALISVARNSIEAASGAEETASKFATIFSTLGTDGEAAAQQLADAYGLTLDASKEMISGTGDLLTALGYSQEAALKLSVQVQQLAVDLVSFKNFSGGAEGASLAITKALLGERDSLTSLGIKISEVDVQTQIATNNTKGLTFATDKQSKAQATLDLIMKSSANAIGDFARTSHSYANQSRILDNAVKDMSITFGTALLPAMTAAKSAMVKLVKDNRDLIKSLADMAGGALKAIIDGFITFGKHLRDNAAIYKPIIAGLALLATTLGIIGIALLAVAAKTYIASTGFGALATSAASAWAAVLLPVTLVVAAITLVGATAYLLWKNWDDVVGWITTKAYELAATFKDVAATIVEGVAVIEPAFRLIFSSLITIWAHTTGTIIQGAIDIATVLGGVFGLELPEFMTNFKSNLLESAEAMREGGGSADNLAKSLRVGAQASRDSALAVTVATEEIAENTKETDKNAEAKKLAAEAQRAIELKEEEARKKAAAAKEAAALAEVERQTKLAADLKALKDAQKLLNEEERLVEEEEGIIRNEEALVTLQTQLTKEQELKILAAQNVGQTVRDIEVLRTKFESDNTKARIANANKESKERDKISKKQLTQFQLTDKAKAKWEKSTWSERADTTKTGLTAIAGLQNSSNKAAFAVGKSAAIANAIIATYQSATLAFSSLAGIPIIGPVLGGIAAAAAIAAGLGNVSKIRSQKPPQASTFAAGGVVTGPGTSTSDSIPAFLSNNETVLNGRQQANTLMAIAEGGGNSRNSGLLDAIYKLGDRIANMEIVLETSDYQIGRAVNRAVSDGLVLGGI